MTPSGHGPSHLVVDEEHPITTGSQPWRHQRTGRPHTRFRAGKLQGMAKAPSDRHHPSSPLHWQETYPGVQQGHRILILGSFLESPVQTSPGTWRSHAHQPNDLTGNDDVTDCHDRNHRHVGGPPSVGQHDADRPSAGDLSGEDDDPSGDGPHRLPRLPGNHGLAGGSNPLTTRPGTGGRLRAGTPRSPAGRARHDRAFADGAATLRVGAGKTNRHVPMTMINTLIQTDLLTSSVVVRAREIRHHFLSCGQPHDIGCHCLWIIPVLHHVALWKAHRE